MSVAAKAGYFWRSALQGMWHSPFIHAVAVVTLAIALFTVGLAGSGARLVEQLIATLGSEVQLTVYARPDCSEDDLQALAEALHRQAGAAPVRITPAMAMARLAQQLGDAADVLRDLPDNPLPTSFELTVPAAQRHPAKLKQLASEIASWKQVSGVDYGEEAVERLTAIAAAVRLGGLLALIIVLTATVVIVSSTLQLGIYARREEVEIQKLVGATDTFVKTPFLIEGTLQGVLGAGMALGALWAFLEFTGPRLATAFSFLRVDAARFQLFDLTLALELVGLGLALGLGGSFVAVGRFLKT